MLLQLSLAICSYISVRNAGIRFNVMAACMPEMLVTCCAVRTLLVIML